jgi:serine/threonine protein kinase
MYANMHYGAPEQWEPRWKEYTQKPCVDVYSVGALLYFLLIKQNPPHWGDWAARHWEMLEERLEGQIPASVVRGLVHLLQRMVVREPERRMQRIDEAISELNRLVAISQSGGGIIEHQAWRQQVCYKVTGKTSEDGLEFVSRAGHVRCSLSTSPGKRGFRVEIELRLVVEPSLEGVDYQGYRSRVGRRIDERLRAFEDSRDDVRARRSGFPTESSSARIEMEGLSCTLDSASAVGLLLVQINQALQ